jgi:alkanesulfonate monooxygenase
MRLADAPEKLREETQGVTERGLSVGLRLSVIVRATRAEAVRAAHSLLERAGGASGEDEFVRTTDSVSFRAAYELAGTEWITPVLWAGAVRAYGPPALALVGTPADVAGAIMEYASVGVSQFILSGWPKLEEMQRFNAEVLPLVGHAERAAAGAAV